MDDTKALGVCFELCVSSSWSFSLVDSIEINIWLSGTASSATGKVVRFHH